MSGAGAMLTAAVAVLSVIAALALALALGAGARGGQGPREPMGGRLWQSDAYYMNRTRGGLLSPAFLPY